MTARKVHVVATWWCLDCDTRGDPVMDQNTAQRDADRHTKDTGHGTATSLRPAR